MNLSNLGRVQIQHPFRPSSDDCHEATAVQSCKESSDDFLELSLIPTIGRAGWKPSNQDVSSTRSITPSVAFLNSQTYPTGGRMDSEAAHYQLAWLKRAYKSRISE